MDRASRAVEQWNRERPDLDVSTMRVLGRLGECALVITRDRINPLFAQFGLQPGEFDVLATLRRSGKPYALTPTALYEDAMISSGSMTNRIDRLEKAGLVARKANPDDGRATLVMLTRQGIKLIDEAVVAHLRNQAEVLSPLDAAEQEQLSSLLGKLLKAYEE
ncbi:MarR family winged helix-turn-helix transcriptional regulator [Achromobacter deleyi]|uniref:MarR family winged helix-turn-helix transcriptional regulator n=1 Tax=Achromobacter deleyi TaxID=1353891 RepID=UPI001491A7A9|nr:MarR family transcriptional regulator [Achromobacter deleyi]QVQ28177.1 MarR family transcriptional regulator [Achromobacter deleyi]UIP18366.1 MarR family transcriptional regulator [Achromobacter deleyi]